MISVCNFQAVGSNLSLNARCKGMETRHRYCVVLSQRHLVNHCEIQETGLGWHLVWHRNISYGSCSLEKVQRITPFFCTQWSKEETICHSYLILFVLYFFRIYSIAVLCKILLKEWWNIDKCKEIQRSQELPSLCPRMSSAYPPLSKTSPLRTGLAQVPINKNSQGGSQRG